MPGKIWATHSYRRIEGMYGILIDTRAEEIKLQAAMHGIKLDGKPTAKPGDNVQVVDLRNIKTEEEWLRARSRIKGFGIGT